MNEPQDNNLYEINAYEYASEFLRIFDRTTEKFYKAEVDAIMSNGYHWIYHSLFKKELGKTVSIAIFISFGHFYLFFIKTTSSWLYELINASGNPNFDISWGKNTPDEIKKQQVMEALKITESQMIDEEICIRENLFLSQKSSIIRIKGRQHGRERAMKYGVAAKTYLPQLREQAKSLSSKLSIRNSYLTLKNNKIQKKELRLSPQQVGHKFESLIRDVLNLYGWQAKKVQLQGEGNDFTAIFDGHHILGETRWEKKPINGEAVDAFAGKLTPRPVTIGLMISYAGFSDGAYSAVKRQIQHRTIVFFSKEQIEKIIISLVDPGEIFSTELRNVYDYLFEKVKREKKREETADFE